MLRVRTASWMLSAALLAALVTGPRALVKAEPQGPPSVPCKIAVVNFKAVLADHTRFQAELKKLTAEKDVAQAEIDRKLDDLRKRKEEYEQQHTQLSQEERDKREDALNRALRQLVDLLEHSSQNSRFRLIDLIF